jgi:sterol desaturase/sphingolipid hydroxylase (fatty acid hydroxylase superfamily)
LSVFLVIGLLAHLAEKQWPLRTYSTPKSWAVNAFGLIFGAAISFAFRKVFPHTFGHLPNIHGFEWIAASSEFVATTIPWPIAFVVSAVVLDFLLYLNHRLMHTQLFWHTHAAHHSVEHLHWFAGLRGSPVHVVAAALCGALLGMALPVNGGAAGLLATVVLYTCIQHFNHANINWRLGPLEWLFVVPRYHFVHHGADPKLNNSNFGFLLTIWDRMFGTYTNPDHVEENFPLGLNYEVGLVRLFIGLPPEKATRSIGSQSGDKQILPVHE